jgi:FkbM family methyltransferase
MSPLIYRSVGKLIKGLRRLGLDVRPTTARSGGFNGMRLQWRGEGDDTIRGAIVSLDVAGVPLRLFVANDMDVIQSRHRQGTIYEPEELAIIAENYRGGTFLDVGSNVGNHAVYAALVLGATRVIAFEPQVDAAQILDANIALNGLHDRITVHRVGLSDCAGSAALQPLNNNLGATRLVANAKGSGGVQLAAGDDIVGDEPVAFVKIDTEGFEMEVLAGLRQTIARDRPTLFVEVENVNVPAFREFCAGLGFAVTREFRRYDSSINLLAVPPVAG